MKCDMGERDIICRMKTEGSRVLSGLISCKADMGLISSEEVKTGMLSCHVNRGRSRGSGREILLLQKYSVGSGNCSVRKEW